MERQDRNIIGFSVGLAVAFIFLFVIGCFYYSQPKEIEYKPWMPKNTKIEISALNVYLSGTAIVIHLTEFKNRFGDADEVLCIVNWATKQLNYVAKDYGLTYAAMSRFATKKVFHEPIGAQVIDDNKIVFNYRRSMSVLRVGACVTVALIIFLVFWVIISPKARKWM